MYTGDLIRDLIATVTKIEKPAKETSEQTPSPASTNPLTIDEVLERSRSSKKTASRDDELRFLEACVRGRALEMAAKYPVVAGSLRMRGI